MKPNDNERFVQAAVEALIKKAMTIKLENMTWDEEACRVAAMELCGDIKEQVKGELAGRIPPFAKYIGVLRRMLTAYMVGRSWLQR